MNKDDLVKFLQIWIIPNKKMWSRITVKFRLKA